MLAPLVVSIVLNPLNSTLITVALVPIGHHFGVGPSHTAWLLTSLYVASAVTQPILGQLVDIFGARRVMIAGSVGVIVAGAGGLMAPTFGSLVAVRAVLGCATCAGFPATMAILREHAPGGRNEPPSRVLSLLAISVQTIMIVGPALGGALVLLLGWQSIFAVNIPLGALGLVMVLKWLPADRPVAGTSRSFDVVGIVLFSSSVLSGISFLTAPSTARVPALAACAVIGGAFVWREMHTPSPFMDLRMLRSEAPLVRTIVRQALGLLVVYGILFGYVQWAQVGRGLNETTAGLVLMPMSAVALVTAAAIGRAHNFRAILIGSAVAFMIAAPLLSTLDGRSSIATLLIIAAIFGLGHGFMGVSNQAMLYRQAPADAVGVASGLFRSIQYLGGVVGATIIGLCYGSSPDTAGLHRLSWTLTGIAAAVLLLTALDPALKRVRRAEARADAPIEVS
jgi:MFS family permease